LGSFDKTRREAAIPAFPLGDTFDLTRWRNLGVAEPPLTHSL
jgi:hypothetical protein